jgi:hypothetical protein
VVLFRWESLSLTLIRDFKLRVFQNGAKKNIRSRQGWSNRSVEKAAWREPKSSWDVWEGGYINIYIYIYIYISIHIYLIWAMVRGERLTLLSGRFTSRERAQSPRYPLNRGLDGPLSRSGLCAVETNFLPLLRIEPRLPSRLSRLSCPRPSIARSVLRKVESGRFWRWCTTLRITGFVDFVHRPEFYIVENTTFGKLGLFSSSGEGRESPTLLGPLE